MHTGKQVYEGTLQRIHEECAKVLILTKIASDIRTYVAMTRTCPPPCPDVGRAAAEDQKGLLAKANERFDAVWCPLPIWVKIFCVIGVSAKIVSGSVKSICDHFPCVIISRRID